ncbi:tRNA (cytosine(38)-C(5))-methyltransferase [Uranotaenia lowii]|uniref:tRNA (cytosine(38)-C(5))-methyltransferase n=1 Tax=Uranotaenia lowii TaxID=190385 RepID=UPI00247ABE2D|nr:tRNA (cytosine(38)-C(5))-methyltransferase [Uranotaenia lowii]
MKTTPVNDEVGGTVKYSVLELFSGIGGMHYALKRSGKRFRIVAALDINPVGNGIYNYNFGGEGECPVDVKNSNILGLTAERIQQLGVNVIAMSPPCQPFTRNGTFKDLADRRADPFVHLCDLLEHIPAVEFVLLENVKGFERSQACELYKGKLTAAGFNFREYILSPHDFGVPNTRHRYYCVAKKGEFRGVPKTGIITEPNPRYVQPRITVGDLLEPESEKTSKFLFKPDLLRKRLAIMDICSPESVNSMCFTKAYTHYAEGTGSVFSPLSRVEFDNLYRKMEAETDEERKNVLRDQLRVRYFTPREVARLMSFPEDFRFPPDATDKQCYRVLGNSINVLVVSSLFDELE